MMDNAINKLFSVLVDYFEVIHTVGDALHEPKTTESTEILDYLMIFTKQAMMIVSTHICQLEGY